MFRFCILRFAMKSHTRWLVTPVAALAFSGCTTMQPLTIDSARLASTLKRGDDVQLVTKSGQEMQFAIDQIDANGVQGAGQTVAYNDIQSISRKQISVGRTALLALGVIGAGALAASGGGGGGGGGSGY